METAVRKLVQQYVGGWKENNLRKILAPLASDCVIIESHGPRYRGKAQVKKWVEYWQKEKWKVKRWNILSFYYLSKKNIAVFEWDFACRVSGKDHALLGISIIKFRNNKIVFIHEYKMSKQPYNWNAKQLNPE